MPSRPLRFRATWTLLIVSAALSACGGGGGTTETTAPPPAPTPTPTPAPYPDIPTTRAEAARFLIQATMGPTQADIDRVMSIGYKAWLAEQFAIPASTSYRSYWDAQNTAIIAADAAKTAGTREIADAFFIQSSSARDQLRQRVAFALSQIFVVSSADSGVANIPQSVASYSDMLGSNAFGNYRQLIENVSLHPAMGVYLSHIRNLKEDPAKGRVPDQNYAREVMQLFSIGLLRLDSSGRPIGDGKGGYAETYGPLDISGLSKVFTGFSWSGPDTSNARFWGNSTALDPARLYTPMQAYPWAHSISSKDFLGVNIPTQSSPDPTGSLNAALEALSNHPNRAPFIAKQLIQRLVTSNPSPEYVARASSAFAGGDMKALIEAILLDKEARTGQTQASFGKVKEPLLRLTQFIRAMGAKSDTGQWLVGLTDDPGSQLGQSFLRSPSVFNFYRPGYVPPNSEHSKLGLVAPELQILTETSAAGYSNYMLSGIKSGFGQQGVDFKATRRDIQIDWTPWIALADQPDALVNMAKDAHFPDGGMNDALRALILDSVNSISIPAPTANNAASIATAKQSRAWLVNYLCLISPEYLVAK